MNLRLKPNTTFRLLTKQVFLSAATLLLGNLCVWTLEAQINSSCEKRAYIFLDKDVEEGSKPEIDISLPEIDKKSKSGKIFLKVRLLGFWNEKKHLDGREFDMLEIPGGAWMTDVGYPATPTLSVEIVIPPQSELDRIDCHERLIKKLENITIFPAQEPQRIEKSLIIDPVVYEQTEPFPGKYYEITADGFMGEQHILVLRLFPIQFTPADKTVNVYSLDIYIIFSLL